MKQFRSTPIYIHCIVVCACVCVCVYIYIYIYIFMCVFGGGGGLSGNSGFLLGGSFASSKKPVIPVYTSSLTFRTPLYLYSNTRSSVKSGLGGH